MATISASDFCGPKHMKGFTSAAVHVLDTVKGIPTGLFGACAGIILITAKEMGIVGSGHSGYGVSMSHNKKDSSWSSPVAVSLGGVGFGAVFGYANKDVLVLLNPAGMERLLQGHGQLKIDAETGFAAGKVGGNVGAAIAGSDAGGFATSFVFTHSKGMMLSAEVEICIIDNVANVNKEFYGTDDVKKILHGEATIPEGDTLVSDLHAKMKTRMAD